MKKLLRIAIVITMALCLSVTAFAAGSKTNTVDTTAVDAAGNAVELAVSAGADQSLTAQQAMEAIAVAGVKADDLTVHLYDAQYVGEGEPVFPLTITFSGYAAGENDTVYVLHYDNGAWVKVGEGTGKTVSATFAHLSPVAVVVVNPTATPGTSTPSGGDTSPKTGEQMVVLYAGALIVLAGAVAFAARKKENV